MRRSGRCPWDGLPTRALAVTGSDVGKRLGPDPLGRHQAGPDPAGDVEGPGVRRRDHAAAEAVDGVVGQPDGVLVVARVRHDGEHGPEDLLLGDPQVVAADEDRGLVVEALVNPPVACPRKQLGPLLESRCHIALDALALLLADKRAEHGALVRGRRS